MTKVSLNERIWFGKHKGTRVKDILDKDPKHLNDLLKNGISLDDDCEKYLKTRGNNPWDRSRQSKYRSPGIYTSFDYNDHNT